MRIFFVIALLLATGCSATQNESTASTAELVETTLGAPTTTVSVRVAACLETKQCDGAVLAGESLAGADLYYADLSDAKLAFADLSGANLEGANLEGADVSGANLSGANLVNAKVSGAIFSGAKFDGATFNGFYEDADASKADFRGAVFLRIINERTSFVDFDLGNADFSGCDVSNLRLITFDDSRQFWLVNANFDRVTNSDTDQYFALINANCFGCTFRGANLIGSFLGGVDFGYSDFTGAVVTDGFLDEVDFTGANLTNASFLNASNVGKKPQLVLKDVTFSNTTMPDGTIRDK